MTELEIRKQVVETAKQWNKRKESDGSHREIIDTYNQIRPLPAGYKMKDSDPWCAAFVSAVGQKLNLTDVILPECGCDRMIALYRAKGRYATPDSGIVIQPADLIFYDWDRNGTGDHVGMIVEVTADGYLVIEGNKSDEVGYRTIHRNYNRIKGFALPDYAAAATEGEFVEIPAEISIEPEQAEDSAQKVETEDTFKLEFHYLRFGAGMKGQEKLREEVRAVQQHLKGLGFDIGPDGADGELGTNTENAVKQYQRAVGLRPDGEVGPLTRARMHGLT